jgi:LuxR family maltose regulon positive regulatory protein
LRLPWSRAGLVARASLVDQLLSAEAPVIAVVAPPGYGKSTLLSQLQQQSPLRTAWVSVDEFDNDPAVLVGYLAAAFDQIEPIGSGTLARQLLTSAADLGSFLRRLAVVTSSIRTPFSLALDHVEAIDSQGSRDAVAELAFNVPPGSRLVLASRRELPLPMARLRARGTVIEVGVDELAMSEQEAHDLLEAADVELDGAQFDELSGTKSWRR